MSGLSILVVDDEREILDLISYNLSKERFQVHTVSCGEDALAETRRLKPDLILLDLMLPGVDGIQVARILKHDPDTREIPIIMITARSEETDIVTGLDSGADDYVTKPFSPRILLSRIRSVIRRARRTGEVKTGESLRIHDLVIDPNKFKVYLNGVRLELTYTEFQLLYFLAKRPGWVYSRYQIVDALRGEDYPVTERSVDVQIVGLRKKLGAAAKYIETVRNVGYRFKE